MPATTLLHAIHFAAQEPTCKEGTIVCPVCSVGCRLSALVENNRVVRIVADQDAAPSHGRLCSRSDALAADQSHAWNRIKHPMIRRHRGEALSRVSWDQALTFVADEIQRVQISRGRGAIGWIGGGDLDTESAYVFNKLFKGFLGTNHVDGGTPSGLAAASHAMNRAFGGSGSTACFNDVLSADVTIILGCDVATSHPVLFEMIGERRSAAPNSRVIVLDSRRTATAQSADVHVPLNPGGEAAFLQLVAKRLLALGRVEDRFVRRYAEGFTDYRVALESQSEGVLLAMTGVHPGRVDEVVDFLQDDGRLLTIFDLDHSDGIDSRVGAASSQAIAAAANLHIQLGELGHEGSGLLSLSTQSNAMGIAEAGAVPGGLPGYRSVRGDQERMRMEVKWGVPAGSIQQVEGMTSRHMLEASAQAEMGLLWIAGNLPPGEGPDANLLHRAMQGCERVIVQDATGDSEAAAHADVLLPTAMPLEKTSTRTTAERLVVRSPQLIDAPGEAVPDWWIAARLGQLMGFDGFEYANEDAVWNEYRHLTEATACDLSGMTPQRLAERPLHWPCPDERHVGTVRRFMSGRFPTLTGRAQFTTPDSR